MSRRSHRQQPRCREPIYGVRWQVQRDTALVSGGRPQASKSAQRSKVPSPLRSAGALHRPSRGRETRQAVLSTKPPSDCPPISPHTTYSHSKRAMFFPPHSASRRVAGFSTGPALCLAVTIGATIFALKSAPTVSFRRAPEFIRFRTVERSMRGVFTTAGQGSNFVRLLGIAAMTLTAGVAMMRTVKNIDEAGWLNFIPFCAIALTIAAGVILALSAAGLRVRLVPTPQDVYVDMAFNLMAIVLGVVSAIAGKLSNV